MGADLLIFPARPLTERQREVCWDALRAYRAYVEEIPPQTLRGSALAAALNLSFRMGELEIALGCKPAEPEPGAA